MAINKENSAPARILPSEDENPNGPISGGGSTVLGVGIVWQSNSAHTTYIGTNTVQPFVSGGNASGRFVITLATPTAWAAFRYWVEDETTNSGEPDGYFYNTLAGQNDVTVVPESFDLTAVGFAPPAVIYVSSLRSEKRILKIEPYTAVSGGEPSGTPLDVISVPLTPPAQVVMHVSMEAPDGRVSSRWRKISFATTPMPYVQAGSQVLYNSSYITSPTRIKTDSFLWLNGTGRFKPARGKEVFLMRGAIRGSRTAGSLIRPLPRAFFLGQTQWRRVIEVGNTDDFDYGYVEYERPFDPPLVADDNVAIIDNCVMVNVQESPHPQTGPDAPEARFEPTLGPLYIDTWASTFNVNNRSDFIRSLRVQAYVHAANYPEDGDYEYTTEDPYQASTGASFPRGEIAEVSIHFNVPPQIYTTRIVESIENTGMLVAEITETLGDINRWRMYARAGGALGDTEWPTLDGTKNTVPDEQYLVIDAHGLQRQVETTFDLSDTHVRAVFVAYTFDGEPGPPSYVFRAPGPETTPQITGVTIAANDDFTESKNVITWTSRNIDPAWGFRIEHHREDHRGISHGENPSKVILVGPAITVDTGSFTHLGNTSGAYIDGRRNFHPLFSPTPHRVMTHHYDFWVTIDSAGNEVFLGRFSRTDSFIGPIQSNVSFGTLYARHIYDAEFDANGRVTHPVTISLGLVGAQNLHYAGESTLFETLIQYEYSIDGGSTWHRVSANSQRISMQADRCSNRAEHKIWGHQRVTSGGTLYSIIYRCFYQQQTDFTLGVRRALVTSDPVSIRLAPVAEPGPF